LEIELFLDIPGVSRPVRPEVACREKDLFQAQLYAKNHGFVIFDSPEVNKIVRFVRPDTPNPEWVKQQAEKLKVKREAVENAYANLRRDIWKYWVRAGEILAYSPYSERIDNPDLNRKSKKPVLVRGYKVLERSKGDYIISGGEVIEVDWPKERGIISKSLSELLNTEDNTDVVIASDPKYREGLKSLVWSFYLRRGPVLYSDPHPWFWLSNMGYLLGKGADYGDFVKIPRDGYRKMVEVWHKIRSLYEEWQELASELLE
ncbi:MAG: hypothetical protein QMD14_04385, partial [Candidatus Aenigmarchaeota archaeon]|nr:hypothetical protein [Candidatus Aenigmarchaeota archaeon]